jgi:transposase
MARSAWRREDGCTRDHSDRQPNLFVKITLNDLVPAEHPLRPNKRMADQCLREMSRTFAAACAPDSTGGRLSIPPERHLKATVLMSLYAVRSERAMCERTAVDMLLRWFLHMTPDEPCCDHSAFSVNRERIDPLDIRSKLNDRPMSHAAPEETSLCDPQLFLHHPPRTKTPLKTSPFLFFPLRPFRSPLNRGDTSVRTEASKGGYRV